MLDILAQVEQELPELLTDVMSWESLFIDYHPPIVERLWRPWRDDYRVYVHRIHPCEEGEALFHPHPWPSVIKIVTPPKATTKALYEMGVGFGPGDIPPPIAAKLLLAPGSVYEMTEPNGWHFVRPIDEPSLSIMVTGKPWIRSAPGSDQLLRSLSMRQHYQLLTDFESIYCT